VNVDLLEISGAINLYALLVLDAWRNVPTRPHALLATRFAVALNHCGAAGTSAPPDIQTMLNTYTEAVSEAKREGNSKVVRMVLPLSASKSNAARTAV